MVTMVTNWKQMFRVLVDFIEREKVMLTVLILLIMALVVFVGGHYIFGRDINESILVAIILPLCVVLCLSVIVDPCFHSVLELEIDDDDDEPLDSDNGFLSPDSELFRMITEAEETEKKKKGD